MLDKTSDVESFRASMKAADEVILVVDHTSLGRVGTAVLSPLDRID